MCTEGGWDCTTFKFHLIADQKVDEKLYFHSIFHFWSDGVTSILIVN